MVVTQPQNPGLLPPLPLIKRCSKLHGANRLSDAVKLLESWANTAAVKKIVDQIYLSIVEFQQEVAAYHPSPGNSASKIDR